MLKDKMNFIRGNEAFVSYVQSLKENKVIRNLKEIDGEMLAMSFLLYKVPYVKELWTLSLQNKILDERYKELAGLASFKTQNQEKQFE